MMDPNKRTVLISVVGVIAAIGLMVGAGFGIARAVHGGVTRLSSAADRQIERVRSDEPESEDGAAVMEMRLGNGQLSGFDTIKTLGGWSIVVTGGDSYEVSVTGSEAALEDVGVFTRGSALHLEINSGLRSVTGNLRADVVLPDLERLESDGSAKVTLNSLDLDRLSLDVDGAASLRTNDVRIEDLKIDVDGASSLDFSNAEVVNADVDMDGASSLDITMAGGVLTGGVSGLGEVKYGGSVTTQSIDVDGLGRVRQR
jgi:hypothetical protein